MKWLSWFQGRRVDNTGSANSAVLDRAGDDEFLWLEGRRHLNSIPYVLPKDVQEINRLDFQHYMIRYAIQRNYVSPIRNPQGILDVGCGTGRWAYEMATIFPRTKVFGLDLISDSAKDVNTIPTNYRFIHGNILEELPFPDMTFDFVHQRFMHVAIPLNSWYHTTRELARVTRPRGWVEVTDSDLLMQNAGPATQRLTDWGFELSRRIGIDPRASTQMGNFMHAAGLINIQMYRLDLPIGSWGGRLGNMAAVDLHAFNRSLKPKLVQVLGISAREYDWLTEAMRQEWENNHSYFSLYITCGQRPQ